MLITSILGIRILSFIVNFPKKINCGQENFLIFEISALITELLLITNLKILKYSINSIT